MGPLSAVVPPDAIRSMNREVEKVVTEPNKTQQTRGPYVKFTASQKALIGKRAAEHGVTSSIRHFSKKYPEFNLKETTVRRFKKEYLAELKKRHRDTAGENSVTELPSKKVGRPTLLGKDLEEKLRAYITVLREDGAVVNTKITIASARGVILSHDANLLRENGGHIELTKCWAKSFLQRMGFVKRKGTTKSKVSVADFDAVKEQFLLDVKSVVLMEEIPHSLIINWDQTGVHYVPVSDWTMEKRGSKRIEIAGIDDKRQLTAVFACSMTGDFLPPQLVYQGKTDRCLPCVSFPSDWSITCSPNHWSNEQTMRAYILKIIVPYVVKKREELKLVPSYPALVLFDNFSGQCTDGLFKILSDNNINYVFIPPNCTDRLQPLDVSVNKAAKNFLHDQFQEWYAESLRNQILSGEKREAIDLRMSVVKPLGAKWMMKLYDYFKTHPEIIQNGFRGAGITEALSDTV